MKPIYFIFIIILCIIFSCNNHRKNGTNYNKNKEKVINQSIDKNSYLVNRIPNCDSAIVYMDNTILPLMSKLPLKERGFHRGTIRIYIAGESNDFYKNEKYNFYINTKCLEGLNIEKIIKIFCTPESYDSFISINKAYLKDGLDWGLEISSPNGFGMGIKVVNGLAEKVVISGSTISSK